MVEVVIREVQMVGGEVDGQEVTSAVGVVADNVESEVINSECFWEA